MNSVPLFGSKGLLREPNPPDPPKKRKEKEQGPSLGPGQLVPPVSLELWHPLCRCRFGRRFTEGFWVLVWGPMAP